MNQTKLESLLETCINIASGFIISILVWSFIVAPLWGMDTSIFDNFAITGIFTVSAIIRGYFWRRFFANGIHKKVHQYVKAF